MTSKQVLPCHVTHCLMDFRLHFFTQHALKHKGIAKFLCLEKEQKIDHITKGTSLKCQSHSQLYSTKNKEILTVILSLLLKKLIWNQREGIYLRMSLILTATGQMTAHRASGNTCKTVQEAHFEKKDPIHQIARSFSI